MTNRGLPIFTYKMLIHCVHTIKNPQPTSNFTRFFELGIIRLYHAHLIHIDILEMFGLYFVFSELWNVFVYTFEGELVLEYL